MNSFSRWLFFGLTATTLACGKADEEEQGPTAVNVRTVTVTARPFTESVGGLGVVSARAGHIATLSAPGPTRVTRVTAVEGQHVAVGTPLIAFEQTIFAEQRRSAEAKVSAALHAYNRAKSLSEGGILPREDVEQVSVDL